MKINVHAMIARRLPVVALWLVAAADSYAASPTLDFATFYGGNTYDRAQGCTVDKDGYIYLAGNTSSTNLRALGLTTPGAVQPYFSVHQSGYSNTDAFVAKLSPDGRQLIWGTYLGGNRQDRGYGVRVDDQGYVYVVGITESTNFPTTPGAFQRTQKDVGTTTQNLQGDIFVSKLTPDGSALVYSTYVGGSKRDWSRGGMWVMHDGSLYVSGDSKSPDFPTTPGAYDRAHADDIDPATGDPSWDGVVFQLAPDGASLIHSTFLGGDRYDSFHSGLIRHTDGTIYVAGPTNSSDLPVSAGALQPTYGGDSGAVWSIGDGLVARFSADLATLIFCTYLGGNDDDTVAGNQALEVDAQSRAVVLMGVNSGNYPVTAEAFDTSLAPGTKSDSAVTVISPDGKTIVASTFLGGLGPEEPSGIVLDPDGNIYLSGNTGSADFPTSDDALQKDFGGGETDVFFTVLSADCRRLHYSTFYGGGGTGAYGERGRSIYRDPTGNVVISGDCNVGFATTPGALRTTYAGGSADAFVLRLATAGVVTAVDKNNWQKLE